MQALARTYPHLAYPHARSRRIDCEDAGRSSKVVEARARKIVRGTPGGVYRARSVELRPELSVIVRATRSPRMDAFVALALSLVQLSLPTLRAITDQRTTEKLPFGASNSKWPLMTRVSLLIGWVFVG